LTSRTVQIQLAAGSLSVHIRRIVRCIRSRTRRNLAFTGERPVNTASDVDPNGQTTNSPCVKEKAEATGGGSNFHMDSGEMRTVSRHDSLTFYVGRAQGPDDSMIGPGLVTLAKSMPGHHTISRTVIGY